MFSSFGETRFGEAEGDETLSASECEDEVGEIDRTKGEEDMEVCSDVSDEGEGASKIELHYGPETRDEWAERLKLKLKDEFNKVNAAGKESDLFVNHGQQSRAIVDVDLEYVASVGSGYQQQKGAKVVLTT